MWSTVVRISFSFIFFGTCLCERISRVLGGGVLVQYPQQHTPSSPRRWRRLPDGRQMKYLRIDGSTTLEDRESAIQRFNDPEGGVWPWMLPHTAQLALHACNATHSCIMCTIDWAVILMWLSNCKHQ